MNLRLDPLGHRSRFVHMNSSSIRVEVQPLIERVQRGEQLSVAEGHVLDCAYSVWSERGWQST